MSNYGYTTDGPYIEADKFGTQTLSYQQITSIRTTPSTASQTPCPRSKSRPTPAVCISRYADSTRNSFNARGLCAKTPLNQHRKILHPLAWPLRLLSQGPKAQIPHGRKEDGSLPDPLGQNRHVRFDSKPSLQR